MNKQLFQDYAELEAQIKKAKEQQDEIKGQLLEEMETEDVDRVEADYGTFSTINRTTYEFTVEIKEEITKLKSDIKEIESKGQETAQKVETKSLRFQAKK